MPYAPDAYVTMPISGSVPSVFVRMIQQATSSSCHLAWHPGGTMTESFLLVPANPNRLRFTLLNSGSLALGMASGHGFNPNAAPTQGSHFVNIIPGSNVIQQGNQPTQRSVAWEAPVPCYTGPLYVGWIGSGSLSGSCAILTEFSAG